MISVPNLIVLGPSPKKAQQAIPKQTLQAPGVNGAETRPILKAYCGKTGGILWETSLLEVESDKNVGLLEILDLDGDGRPEVIVQYKIRSEKGWESTMMIRVLEGSTGMTRWKKVSSKMEFFRGENRFFYAHLHKANGRLMVVGAIRLDPATGNIIIPKQPERNHVDEGWPSSDRHWRQIPKPFDDFDKKQAGFMMGVYFDKNAIFNRNGEIRLYFPEKTDATICSVGPGAKVIPVGLRRQLMRPQKIPETQEPFLLPWVTKGQQRWLKAIGPALIYLGLFIAVARSRRWYSFGVLVVLLVLVPPFAQSLEDNVRQQHGPETIVGRTHDVFAKSGWYWLWPCRLAGWQDGELWANPLTWALLWLVCVWIVWTVRRLLDDNFYRAKGTP